VVQLAFETVPVLRLAHARFKAAEHATIHLSDYIGLSRAAVQYWASSLNVSNKAEIRNATPLTIISIKNDAQTRFSLNCEKKGYFLFCSFSTMDFFSVINKSGYSFSRDVRYR
jgi:hypothetical protein